jgi:putative pyoverdin transport system ATP-binding/permease protein
VPLRGAAKPRIDTGGDAQLSRKNALSAPTGKAPNVVTGTVKTNPVVRETPGPLQARLAAYSAWAGDRMKFIRLLLAEAGEVRWRLVASVVLGGGAMALMMTVVNSIADLPADMSVNWGNLVLFVLCAVAVISMQVYSLNLTAVLSERMIERVRARIAGLIRRSELDGIERIGTVRVYDTVARETTVISSSAGMITYSMTTLVALVLAALYVAALSLLAFAVIVVLLSAWVYFYHFSQRHSRGALVEAMSAESRFFGLLSHLLYGFKEIKLHSARGEDLEKAHLEPASQDAEFKKVVAARRFNSGLTVSYMVFYTLLGAAAFILPQHLDSPHTAVKVVYVVVFMFTTVEGITRALPLLAKVGLALDNLDALEASLVRAAGEPREFVAQPPPSFKSIELDGIVYAHRGQDGAASFTLGPCDLSIKPGETIFVVGGNGSGKSTLTRVLTQLYRAEAGAILWDGALVDGSNAPPYRNLFSAVYADFHLFDRLYGLEGVDPEHVRRLLADVGLADKTQYVDGRFTNVELSTGQRKRLALVVALIEDRPIYVLDELSADQDPVFRQRYYEEFLPALKARGKTLIVVSHDERYFDIGDRVIVMQDGRFEPGSTKR